MNRLITSPTVQWPLISVFLNVGLLLLFAPLQRRLRRWMDWILYGGEVSYATVVGRLAESLSLTLDRRGLRRLLIDEPASAMHLPRSALFLKDENDTLTLVDAIGFEPHGTAGCRLPGDGRLSACLEAVGEPTTDTQVHRALELHDGAVQQLMGSATSSRSTKGGGRTEGTEVSQEMKKRRSGGRCWGGHAVAWADR